MRASALAPRSLRGKMLVPLVAAAVVLSALGSVVVLQLTREQLYSASEQRAARVSAVVGQLAESVQADGLSAENASLQRAVLSLGAAHEALELVVVGGDPARVVASTHREWLGSPLSAISDLPLRAQLLARRRGHSWKRDSAGSLRSLDYAAPIRFASAGGPSLGGVLVRIDVGPLQRALRGRAVQLLVVLVGVLALYTVLVAWHIQRQILSPLALLRSHVARPNANCAEPWLEERRTDELGALATSLRLALQTQHATLDQLEHQKFALDQHSIVAVTDVRGRITYVNDKFCAISKYERAEVLGQDHRILNSGHHPKTFFTDMWRALLRGEVWHGEIQNRAKDGELYWVDTTIVPWLGADGAPSQFIAIRTDITERKRDKESLLVAKVAAEAASEAKSAFLANISHEIRTPLNAVIGLTGLLLETPLQGKQRELLHIVQNSSDALLDLLNDVLDYSKIEANKVDIETNPFDVRALLDTTVDLFGAQFAQRGLELIAYVADGVPSSVLGDVTRYRQVLVNLVSNAMKFTLSGEVEVSIVCRESTRERATLLLTVRDTGIGIPAHKLDGLFRPFTQLDSSMTRRFGGSGLGLAICKRFAELMNGKLWVESVEGQGSRFFFEVSLKLTPRASPVRWPADVLRDQRILVLAQNATTGAFVGRVLEKCGAEVSLTQDADAACALLSGGGHWSAVVTEAASPALDPGQLEAETRSRLGSTQLPLVVMSSNLSAAVNARGKLATVAKPLKVYPLIAAVQRALRIDSPSWRPAVAGGTGDPTPALRSPLRILLAEDNPVNQKVALMMLERFGYRAKVASDGRQAIAAVRAERFDLILMDVHMPEVDGFRAAREILGVAASQGYRPRVVALTASVMAEERAAAVAAGMDDFLAKPLRAKELLRVITACSRAGVDDPSPLRSAIR